MTAFYRALLRLYPASFRADYESELARTFEEKVRERGKVGASIAAIGDVVPNAIAAHWEILSQDLHYTVRSLQGSRGFAVASILVTALGVGANTATFSVADFVLVRPLGFAEPERLVRLCDGPREGGGWGCNNQMTPKRFVDVTAMNRSFEAFGAFARRAVNLVGAGEPVRVSSASVTPDVLPLLGVRPFVGRVFDRASPERDAQTVVIGYGLWQSQLGSDPTVIGKTLNLDGASYVVIGVMPAHFRFPTEDVQLWLPLLFTPAESGERFNNYLEAVARLKRGVTFEQARADMDAIEKRLAREDPEANQDRGFSFFKQRDEMSPRYRTMLLALCGASLCMLLLTCANLANLLLARAAGREREIAVRAALGAGRERLMRQMLTESVALALVGGIAGALMAKLAVPLLARLVPSTLPIAAQPTMDLRVFAIAATLSALTGLGFGLFPAMRVGGRTGFDALRDGARGSGRRKRLRTVLVAVEVAVSVVLLIGSGLLIRAMLRVQAIDPGFVADRVLTLQTALPTPKYDDTVRRADFYRRVLADVRALPGVQSAAYTSGLPFVMTGGISLVLLPGETDRRGEIQQITSYRVVTSQFFSTLRIPMRQGRDFRESDTGDGQPVAIVSEAFVRTRLPNQDPIGKTLQTRSDTRTIVGVVGDIMVRGLERTSEPQLYVPAYQKLSGIGDYYLPKVLLVRSSTSTATLVPAIRDIVRLIDPQQPISSVQDFSVLLDEQTGTRRAQLRVLVALATLALLLAAVGIHGLLTFMVAQRDREIGVRLALGAEPTRVGRMIVSEGVRMAVLGVIPGVIIAYLAARGMSSLLFGVRPEDPLTIAVVAIVCFATTVAACVTPALRAARIQPISALRAD